MIWVFIFVVFFAHSEWTFCEVNSTNLLTNVKDVVTSLIPPGYDSSKINFLLWTRKNQGNLDYETIKNGDVESLQKSFFDGSKKTFVLFHGFTDHGIIDWILLSKNNILTAMDVNIISVDYGKLVPAPETNYAFAVSMMYPVAEFTAGFVDWLINKTELTTSNLHFIGHSLGAHAAGMTAQNMKSGKVERITGLDAAGPVFELLLPNKRLDKSQANFVDTMHTNACVGLPTHCRGIIQAIGHTDFYVNGGSLQPGCKDLLDILVDIECSHQRATILWNESILDSINKFSSSPCGTRIDCLSKPIGFCGSDCVKMGFYLDKSTRGNYYVETNSAPPYAIEQA